MIFYLQGFWGVLCLSHHRCSFCRCLFLGLYPTFPGMDPKRLMFWILSSASIQKKGTIYIFSAKNASLLKKINTDNQMLVLFRNGNCVTVFFYFCFFFGHGNSRVVTIEHQCWRHARGLPPLLGARSRRQCRGWPDRLGHSRGTIWIPPRHSC